MKKNIAQHTKKILIVCALESELRIAKEAYKKNRPEAIQACFFVVGIGNISASIKLTEKLSKENYDFVLNYGVCGYTGNYKEIIQIARSLYLPNNKELIIPYLFNIAPLASIACSETPEYNPEIIGEENYVDMESYAIEKVCDHFKIPRLILKIPVDKIGEETKKFDVKKAKTLLKQHLDFEKILKKISEYLEKLPKKNSLEKYEEYFQFTVSEKIIFEKYYSKYTSLSGENFEDFFTEYKTLGKKDFLKKLESKNMKLSEI